ncbi:hypothetical protein IH575_03915 [Candidatus Dojkabacteria bacterium]|nr:hypothetical protein [Candidatus Dojkabacteria bacterium]
MILILPGFSIKNKEEAESIASALREKGEQVHLHMWRHWDSPDTKFDPEVEIDLIKQHIRNPSELNIVGKSIGTYIASLMLKDTTVNRLVLLGIPAKDLNPEELAAYTNLSNLEHFVVIHNDKDPHGDIQAVEDLLSGLEYELILKEAGHHSYNYVEDIIEALGLS